MADVAAHVGVSHQTVSRVLNDSPLVRPDTRARVLAAIDELGYRRNSAARMLVTNRSGRIGMVSAHLALHGPSMVSASVQRAAQAAGYDAALVGLDEISADSLRGAVDRLLDQAVEAVVVAVAQRDALAAVAGLTAGVPVVTAQGVEPGRPLAAAIDQRVGARLAVEHLLALGHRTVAHVTGPLDWVEAEQRLDGWRTALTAAGAPEGRVVTGDWTAASGYAAGLALAEDPTVTAVFAANDTMALGLLRALHEQGRRVPTDVSVVGFDDVPEAAYLWPPLTTVEQTFSELGRRAVDLALRALAGEVAPTSAAVEPRLVVRGSTAAPA